MISASGRGQFDAISKSAQRRGEDPVVGWDSEGYALVIDWGAGRLMRAVDLPSFSHLDDSSAKSGEVTGVIPAPPGWILESDDSPTQEVIGWVLNGFGCGNPLVVDTNGTLIVANTEGKTARRLS